MIPRISDMHSWRLGVLKEHGVGEWVSSYLQLSEATQVAIGTIGTTFPLFDFKSYTTISFSFLSLSINSSANLDIPLIKLSFSQASALPLPAQRMRHSLSIR